MSAVETNKIRARLAAVLLIGTGVVLSERAQGAGGAYAVDDADIGPAGSCQAENWVSNATNHDFVGVISPACVVKLGLPVEFTATYQRARTSDGWTTAPSLQAKSVPINNDRIAVSFAVATIYDSATHTTSALFNNPITFKFGKDFRIHTNLGFLHDARVGLDFITGGVGFDWDFQPKFSLMGEVYLQESRRLTELPLMVYEPRTQLGLRYIPIPTVDIDIIYGQNLVGHGAHWVTLGLTVRSE